MQKTLLHEYDILKQGFLGYQTDVLGTFILFTQGTNNHIPVFQFIAFPHQPIAKEYYQEAIILINVSSI